MRNPELYDWSDMELIGELQSRGRLKVERRTVDVPSGLDAQVRYSTGWLIEDEVVVDAALGDET